MPTTTPVTPGPCPIVAANPPVVSPGGGGTATGTATAARSIAPSSTEPSGTTLDLELKFERDPLAGGEDLIVYLSPAGTFDLTHGLSTAEEIETAWEDRSGDDYPIASGRRRVEARFTKKGIVHVRVPVTRLPAGLEAMFLDIIVVNRTLGQFTRGSAMISSRVAGDPSMVKNGGDLYAPLAAAPTLRLAQSQPGAFVVELQPNGGDSTVVVRFKADDHGAGVLDNPHPRSESAPGNRAVLHSFTYTMGSVASATVDVLGFVNGVPTNKVTLTIPPTGHA